MSLHLCCSVAFAATHPDVRTPSAPSVFNKCSWKEDVAALLAGG